MRALFALFIRSLRQDTRAKLPPILRTALVLILLLIIIGKQKDFGRYSDQGLDLLINVMMLNFGFLAVAAVSIFPTAIAEEKEDETLPLLRMTNLSPVSILLGKFAPQLLAGVLLLAVQIPFTLIARALGGVSIDQVLRCYAILGATLFFLCCLALLASVLCRTIVRAGFLTGLLGAFVYVGCPLLISPVMRHVKSLSFQPVTLPEYIARWVVDFHPAIGMAQLLESNRTGAVFAWSGLWWNLGLGVVCLLLAWRLFDRFCLHVAEAVPRASVTKAGAKKPGGRSPGRVSRAWRWALAWKELHFTVGGRRGLLGRLFATALLLGVVWGFTKWIDPPHYYSYPLDDRDEETEARFFWRAVSDRAMTLGIGCGLLEILLIASRIFGQERRGLTLSSLVGLPWSPRRIFWQKVLGCVPAILPWLALIVVGAGLHEGLITDLLHRLGNFTWEHRSDDVVHALYLSSQFLCLLLVTVYFSLRIRRGALPAAIAAMGVANVIFFMALDHRSRAEEDTLVFFGFCLTVVAGFIVYLGILSRLQTAAAED